MVHAETLRFKKEGVFAVVKDVFLPWYNAYRFLVQNVLRLEADCGERFYPSEVTQTPTVRHTTALVSCCYGPYLQDLTGCVQAVGLQACPCWALHAGSCMWRFDLGPH